MDGKRVYIGGVIFSLVLFCVGLLMGPEDSIPAGLHLIFTFQDVLITDYFAIAGPGAAFINAALVTLLSLALLWVCREPVNGYTIVVLGLMAGFSFFGKNVVNILPILAGTWLYARVRRERFAKYAPVGLLATALAPAVSFFALAPDWGHGVLGILIGLVIGFTIPSISAYTYKVQNGMNLYNMGFACGLLALVIVPVMAALGRSPMPALHWSVQYKRPILLFMGGVCASCVGLGSVLGGGKGAWQGYWGILKTTGRAPNDYMLHFGLGPTLINMGVNGFLCMGYMLLTGAAFNGPMLGGFFAVLAFSAFGKHARNITPIMVGVGLGGVALHSFSNPSVQMAGLFGTTLAPLSGCFGWPVGVLAGFLHSCIVLRAGVAAEGVNLYNNGFSAGILAIVLYAVLSPLLAHRRAQLRDGDYFEAVVEQRDEMEGDDQP